MRQFKYSILSLLAFTFICLFTAIFNTNTVKAMAVDNICQKVEIITARGSGNGSSTDSETNRYVSEIERRLGSKFQAATYPLGTESYNNARYPHVPSDWSLVTMTLPVGDVSAYTASITEGVKELQSYLTQRYNKCKSTGTWYVLGGYSQGAHVIGQALTESDNINKEVRDRIAYVGLFGDPKLNFPEGDGGKWSSACRGGTLSKWTRYCN